MFLLYQSFNKFFKNNRLLRKQPVASLVGLSIPVNISIKKKSFTIGKSKY